MQVLLVLALCFAWQSPEGRVAFKRSALLIRILLALLIEPLAGVVPLRRWLVLRIKVWWVHSRLRLRGRTGCISVQVVLRTGFPAFFRARLAILLSLLLVRAGNIGLVVVAILRKRQRCYQGQQQTC